MPVDAGSGRYAFTCSGTNYATRTGPDIQISGRARGGPAILPLTQLEINTVTGQARAYAASGLAPLARQITAPAASVQSGSLRSPRAAWLTAHLTWERLSSAYGMFGAYDDEINGLPFGLPDGVNDPGFTGFYRLEYGLWHGQSAAVLAKPAAELAAAAHSLQADWIALALTMAQRENLDAAAGQTVELLAPIPVMFEQERAATPAHQDATSEFSVPDYAADPNGAVTPLNSHIRLANPRTAETADNQILRRSYNYDRGVDAVGNLDMGLTFY